MNHPELHIELPQKKVKQSVDFAAWAANVGSWLNEPALPDEQKRQQASSLVKQWITENRQDFSWILEDKHLSAAQDLNGITYTVYIVFPEVEVMSFCVNIDQRKVTQHRVQAESR